MSLLDRFLSMFRGKAAPSGVGGGGVGYGWRDAYRSRRQPYPGELLASYRNIAYTCAQLNATAVASVPLRLYVRTGPGQKAPRCRTVSVPGDRLIHLEKSGLGPVMASDVEIREVSEHPLLKLIRNANTFHHRFDLIEWTVLSLDIMGDAYWAFAHNGFGDPVEIWPLEAHRTFAVPDPYDGKVLDHYEYSAGIGKTQYRPGELLHFKYVGLSDPYLCGMSPLRAAFEQTNVSDKLLAYEEAVLDNRARPDMIVSPKDEIGPAEAERLEKKFLKKFRAGGSGGIVVAESGLEYKAMVFPPSDLAALEIRKVSKEELCNAFGVPISLLTSKDVNRANAEAGNYSHAKRAVLPRCRRLEEMLNKELCPLFDSRLFFAFDNPVPDDEQQRRETRVANLEKGVVTINEERRKDGLPPLPWGNDSYLPMNFAPVRMLADQAQSIIDRNRMPGAVPGEPAKPDSHPNQPPKPPKDPVTPESDETTDD